MSVRDSVIGGPREKASMVPDWSFVDEGALINAMNGMHDSSADATPTKDQDQHQHQHPELASLDESGARSGEGR